MKNAEFVKKNITKNIKIEFAKKEWKGIGTIRKCPKFRIPYKCYDGTERTYQPDFLINEKELIEIKPKNLWNTHLVKLKKEAAEKYCKEHNLVYKLVDVEPDSKSLREKYINGEIKFVEKYRERFEKYAEIK